MYSVFEARPSYSQVVISPVDDSDPPRFDNKETVIPGARVIGRFNVHSVKMLMKFLTVVEGTV